MQHLFKCTIDLFRIFVNICDIAIIGNVYVLLCLKKLLQWAARWPPFIILTGQQVMEAALAKYIFMRENTSFKTNFVFPILRYSLFPPLPNAFFFLLLQSFPPPWSKIFPPTKLPPPPFPFPFPPKRPQLPSIFKSEIAYFVVESSFWMTSWWHIYPFCLSGSDNRYVLSSDFPFPQSWSHLSHDF